MTCQEKCNHQGRDCPSPKDCQIFPRHPWEDASDESDWQAFRAMPFIYQILFSLAVAGFATLGFILGYSA